MKKGSIADKAIKAIAHIKDVTPSDLSKYQILIIGENLGSSLTKNLSHFTHGHKTMFNINKIPQISFHPFRIQYELQKLTDITGKMNTDMALCQSVGRSNYVPAVKIDKEKNMVTLENGREIEYETLVLANGVGEDLDFAKGFREALEDKECPVYSSVNVPGKLSGFLPLFEHGECFVYIPEFPFGGEVESYNFLYGMNLWDFSQKIGLVSPKRKVTIVNANDRFANHSDSLNSFILKEIEKYDCEVLYNTKITSFDKDSRKLTLQNSSGTTEKNFNNVYVHLPSKESELLKNSNISKNNLQVEVDPKTLLLKNNPNKNIFALGDVADLPIQRSLFAGFAQNHVVRHNVLQILKNKEINAEYNGYTNLFVQTAQSEAVNFYGDYKEDSVRDYLRYLQGKVLMPKWYYGVMKKVYAGKHPGPPNYKLGYKKWKDVQGKKVVS